MDKGRIISQFLRTLAHQVEQLSDEEVKSLLESAGLKALLSRKRQPLKRTHVEPAEVRAEARSLMNGLIGQPSRDAARELLSSLSPTRRVLIEAAKLREVHVARHDTVASISEKLVENVVGSRLDSARIRGS